MPPQSPPELDALEVLDVLVLLEVLVLVELLLVAPPAPPPPVGLNWSKSCVQPIEMVVARMEMKMPICRIPTNQHCDGVKSSMQSRDVRCVGASGRNVIRQRILQRPAFAAPPGNGRPYTTLGPLGFT